MSPEPSEASLVYRRLAQIRSAIESWNEEWGHPACLQARLEEAYEDASSTGEIEAWQGRMLEKVDEGRTLVRYLHSLGAMNAPEEDWQRRDVWAQGFQLAELLYTGITLIETLVKVLLGR